MRFSGRIFPVVTIVAIIAFAAGVTLLLVHLNHPRVVARAVTPDGVEMCIVQRCNWSAEPFTTAFVFRRPGTEWGWFYYDHQDSYWGKGRVTLDTNARVAVIYRGQSPAVTFAWDTETYTLHRWNRTLTGAQDRLPASWSPEAF